MADPRKPVFDAIRAAKGSILPAEVTLIDDLLDRLGLVRQRDLTRRAINAAGLDIIKLFEGCKLKAYRCPAGVLTIGYGSTGSHVREGMTITPDQAEALLRSDLRRFEDYVATHCAPATDNQFSALVSFCFNVGEGNLASSTLRRLHLEGSYAAAADQFARWNKAGSKVLPGLTRRRAAEAQLYRSAPR